MSPDRIDRGAASLQRPFCLSFRQRQVLCFAARGLTVSEIGRRLGLARQTVSKHLRLARWSLGALNTTHAVALALHHNLIEMTFERPGGVEDAPAGP
jgi:DNA-binding CsgD family transcriptional regulator